MYGKENRLRRVKYVFYLSRHISGYSAKLALALFVHLVYKVIPIVLSFFTSLLISTILNAQQEHTLKYFAAISILVLLSAILHYVDINLSHDVAYHILANLRNKAYNKLAMIAPAGIQSKRSGDMMSVFLEDVELLEWFYAHTVAQIVVAFLLPLAMLIFILRLAWPLALILTFFIGILIVIPFKSRETSDRQGNNLRRSLGILNAVILDGIQGIKDIISFQHYRCYFKKLFKATEEYDKASKDFQLRAAEESRSSQFVMGISGIASIIAVAGLFYRQHLDALWILPLIILSSQIFDPLRDAIAMSTNYGNIFAAAERVYELLEAEPVVKDLGTMKEEQVIRQDRKIHLCFEHVSFSYENNEEDHSGKNIQVLTDLSFEINDGESVCLVGASGSGKTTIIRLLQRFWDPQSGEIKINHIPIKSLSLSCLRQLITVVPQDCYLFNRSIMDNVKLGYPEASDEAALFALQQANAWEFVESLPKGVDTVIGERGTLISGGERQRVALAQAFLKNSPILVLDEASANLDFYNETLINEALERLKAKRLTIMIAHRLSTIKSADRLIFIQEGSCCASGSFDQLFKQNEDFRKLIGETYDEA